MGLLVTGNFFTSTFDRCEKFFAFVEDVANLLNQGNTTSLLLLLTELAGL